jgi:hypothetical protein
MVRLVDWLLVFFFSPCPRTLKPLLELEGSSFMSPSIEAIAGAGGIFFYVTFFLGLSSPMITFFAFDDSA